MTEVLTIMKHRETGATGAQQQTPVPVEKTKGIQPWKSQGVSTSGKGQGYPTMEKPRRIHHDMYATTQIKYDECSYKNNPE